MSINALYPRLNPTLIQNFVKNKVLDSRISFSRNSVAYGFSNEQAVKSEENLLLYSEDFTNVIWQTLSGSFTINSNTEVAPNGQLIADYFSPDINNSILFQSATLTSGDYIFSIWIKSITLLGSIDLSIDGSNWQTVTPTSTWQRFTISQTVPSGSYSVSIRMSTASDIVALWGSQLEKRSFVTDYVKTTNLKISNYFYALKQFASGEPRIITSSFGVQNLGIFIEGQSENLNTYSDDFTNIAYVKTNVFIQSNGLPSLNGTSNVQKIVIGNVTSSNVTMLKQVTLATATVYTLSCYVKYGGSKYIFLGINNSATEYAVAQFDMELKTLQFSEATGIGYSIINVPVITNYDNNWCRINLTFTSNTTTNFLMIAPSTTAWAGSSQPGSNESGNNYDGTYAFGLQIELGLDYTSYIPTIGTTQIRQADNYDLLTDSSWFSKKQGTLNFNFFTSTKENSKPIISIDDNTVNNQLTYYADDNKIKLKNVINGATISNEIIRNTIPIGKVNITSFYSEQLGTKTSSNNSNVTNITDSVYNNFTHIRIGRDLNGNYFNGIIYNLSYYNIAINNNTYIKELSSY